jgi:hypothetical protein
MAISRAQMMKELLPGLNALFGMEYGSYENEHEDIYEMETSDRAFEEEVQLSGFGSAPVKSEGASIAYDTAQEVFTARYNHETVALGFSITEEAIEDNLYDSLSARYTKALARAAANTKQVKAAYPLNNGFSGGAFTSGDGFTLFNASHPRVDGGVNANQPSVASDLNETSLEQAIIDIAGFTDQRGLKIAARARRLIIPPDLQFVATRFLETDRRAGTADNDINALRNNGVIPEGHRINHYLTDPDAWFIITDVPNGMKGFTRTPMQTSMDGDFDTGNVRYKCRERYSFGVSDPLGIYGSQGA